MEQHPIPQNITGFEFKLIGDMTVKQFAYLAGCIALAYLIFISPFHPLLKFPLSILLGLLGIGLAFIPVEGRPLDRWIASFIRALFAPSQYIFHKEGRPPEFLRVKTQSLDAKALAQAQMNDSVKVSPREQSAVQFSKYLHTVTSTKAPLDQEEQDRLAQINEVFTQPQTQPVPPPVPNPVEMPVIKPLPIGLAVMPPLAANQSAKSEEDITKKENQLEEENRELREVLERLKAQLSAQPATADQRGTREQLMQEALTIEKKLQEALSEKERLTSELSAFRSKVSTTPISQQVTPMPAKPLQTEKVRALPPQFAKTQGVAGLPQIPNIVSGIVKDNKGEVLPNIIVEVKDATGNPVRAFKTNKVGQFSASTSLSNGRYTIELEDPQNTYSFDVIGLELTGSILQPLEIMAKNKEGQEKVTERQTIYQSLFGGRNGGQTATN